RWVDEHWLPDLAFQVLFHGFLYSEPWRGNSVIWVTSGHGGNHSRDVDEEEGE
ncbi:hypothetical protein RYX36_026569, partial [Vicia faba]